MSDQQTLECARCDGLGWIGDPGTTDPLWECPECVGAGEPDWSEK